MIGKQAEEAFDMVVVGTGWFGLAAARAYIALHPEERTLVIEAADTCGGTWGEQRIYPGLKSNNLVGRYEYPDFPLAADEERYGVKKGEHIPGAVLHQYLTDFAKKYGIFERTRFNTKLDSVSPNGDAGWFLEVSTATGSQVIQTTKLILATGLTSTPNIPKYTGQENFQAPFFHAKDFHKQRETMQTSKNAVIIGGAKSAYDVAWAYCDAGAQVDLIIRPDGNGPVWISQPYVTPFKKQLECLLHVRALSWMSPCPFGAEDGFTRIRNWLHGTWFGRKVVDTFWSILQADVIDLMGWNKHPETAKLKPWNAPFWTGSALSIHNWDNSFNDLVKSGKIRVHIADVDHLSPKKVHFTTGDTLDADVIICSTGWKKDPSVKFLDFDEAHIGLPQSQKEQAILKAKADDDILTMFPRLKDQPKIRAASKDTEPYRLYRFIVPPAFVKNHNIAFAGAISSVSTSIGAAVQGLWIAAFLDGKLDRVASSNDEIAREVMLHTQWGKWRYPCGYGASLPDIVFDCVPYNDLLLRDLGLESHRKKGFWRDTFTWYEPEDYKGLIEEWVERKGEKKKQ